MLCHLASWARCHWTTHWHFVSFIQNIPHNISHTDTHLLTVPNTAGSVSSLSVTGCQAASLPVLQCLSFGFFVQSVLFLDALLSTMQTFDIYFFFFHSFEILQAAGCNLFFEKDKVTHCGLSHRLNQSKRLKQGSYFSSV